MAPVVAELRYMSPSQEASALAQLTPVQYGDLPQFSLSSSRAALLAVDRRLSTLRDAEKLEPESIPNALETSPLLGSLLMPSFSASADGGAATPPVDPMIAARWGTWASVQHSNVRADTFDSASGTQPGASAGILQVSAGAERRLNENLIAGVMAGYARTHANVGEGLGTTDVTTFLLGTYGTLYRGGLHLDWYAGGGASSYDLLREIPALGGAATAHPSGYQADMSLGGGWDAPFGKLLAGPTASLEYHHLGVDGFTESGAGALNLQVAPQNADSATSSLGLKATRPFSAFGANYEPSVSAAWRHEFVNQDRTLNAAFDSGAGPSFAVRSSGVGADAAALSARLEAKFNESLSAFTEASVELGRVHSQTSSWGAGAKVRF